MLAIPLIDRWVCIEMESDGISLLKSCKNGGA
jgi:hypothetical protein